MNELKQLGYMMSVERAEAFQDLAKAVFDYISVRNDERYEDYEGIRDLADAYEDLMEVVKKETDGEPRVQSTISEDKEQG
jgi:hypothetical protein